MRSLANTRRAGRGPALVLLTWAVAHVGGAAEPDGPVPVADDVVIEQPPSPEAERAAELKLRYAMARLRLAELDLERALAANRVVRHAVGPREIERLRKHIQLMRRQLEILREQPRTAARQATIAAAHLARETARADLDAARAANHHAPGAVSDLNVERLKVRLEVAEIRAALCENPAYDLSILDEMQWNIDQLTDQMIDLRHQVETSAARDFGPPK